MLGKLRILTHPTLSGQSARSQTCATTTKYARKPRNSGSTPRWLDPADEWQLNDRYIPLQELGSTHTTANGAWITGGQDEQSIKSQAVRAPDIDLEDNSQEGIRKTVRIETS